MRTSLVSFIAVIIVFSSATSASAQTGTANKFTANLSLGSRGAMVVELQKVLNADSDTRVADSGPGSIGSETDYFGPLTKNAVIRFQEKYEGDILVTVGLLRGNGYVGLYTRAKLNSLSSSNTTPITTTNATPSASSTDYLIKDSEKIDIYAGDKMIENVQSRITAAINSAIISQSTATATMPFITQLDVPSVVIKSLSPQSGTFGTRISVTGSGISSDSAIYFGNNYIIRTLNKDLSGNFSFFVPSIALARYDIAIKTGNAVSNTAAFVITDPKNPSVHIQSVSPANIKYGGTLTIIGSGFSAQNNVVVTTYQKFANVPSTDGKTLTVQFSPESLRELARVGRGTDKIPSSLYIVNDYGFSDSEKLFTITL